MELVDNIFAVDSAVDDKISAFKERRVKAKEVFEIVEIDKNTAYSFVRKYHYLADAKFFSQQAFGLLLDNDVVGVATFCQPQGNVTLKGWFGLSNQEKCVYELSRLCLLPSLNGSNATSFLLSGAMKLLKKQGTCKAVITLADSSRHIGSIYQVCNFKYYGLSDVKKDFFCVNNKINPRGTTKEKHGVWLPRSRKHRYCFLLDKTLKVRYGEQPAPKEKVKIANACCHNTKKVFDRRFGEWFTCPKCTGRLNLLTEDNQ